MASRKTSKDTAFQEDVARALMPRLTKYIVQAPHPKQAVFLLLNCKEAFYGGAGGGGKSSAMLSAALQYVDIPGYSALVLRRSFAALSMAGSLMSRSHEWLKGTDAKWNDDRKTWTFPSGATVTFGYLEAAKDIYRYVGAEFQFIGWDELTQFTEQQYTYLFSRLRKTNDIPVPLRVRGASNPGSEGHDWVKRRFLIEGPAEGRVFIPATVYDNPSLDIAGYVESLSELDSVAREQILSGNWDVQDSGGKFEAKWFDGKIISRKDLPKLARVVRFWDLAATEPSERNPDPDWTVGVKIGVTTDGQYYILDVKRMRGKPSDVEKLIRDTAEEDTFEVEIFIEEEPGSGGKNTIDHYARIVLAGFSVKGIRVSDKKKLRANPVSSAAEAGNVYMVYAKWNRALLDEMQAFPFGGHDDQVDALSGGFQKLKKKGADMSFGSMADYGGALTAADVGIYDRGLPMATPKLY